MAPQNDEMSEADLITDPVVAEIDCFGMLELDRVIGNASGNSVVAEYDGRRLRIAEFFKDDAEP